MNEEWREIPGLDGHYEASSLGRIRSRARVVIKRHYTGKTVKQVYQARIKEPYTAHGYLRVAVAAGSIKRGMAVHELVLLAFVGPRPGGCVSCHNNGNRYDNRAENLRWDTVLENNRDRVRHGTIPRGESSPTAKLTAAQAAAIRAGEIKRKQALATLGIGNSQFYRIRNGQQWQEGRK